MSLKWLGGTLLVLLAVGYGAGVAHRWQAASRRLAAWVTLLNYIHGQISCFSAPLNEILAHAPHDMLAPLWPRSACDEFEEGSLVALCRASAAELEGESARLLTDLADELGTMRQREQLDCLKVYAIALDKERAALSSALPGRIRMHGALSLCGALAVILLLW